MVAPIAASSASLDYGSMPGTASTLGAASGAGAGGAMPASVSASAGVTIPASATGTAAAAHAPGGFAGMISGLLNLPVGTNGHASASPIPPPIRIAMSAVSSLALGSPFGFASTLFMSFAEEILEMGPDTSRPPVPAGMTVTGQEQGVQPTSPGTLHDGAYTTLATTTPEFLAGTGPTPAAGASPGGQGADVALGWLPGKAYASGTATAADATGAAAAGPAGAGQVGGASSGQAGGQAAQAGDGAVAAAGLPITAPARNAAASGIPGTVGVLVDGVLPVPPAAVSSGIATAAPVASATAAPNAAATGEAAPAASASRTSAATTASSGANATGGAAAAAPAPRKSGWMAAYAGMSEWQRAEAVEKGMV